MTPTSRRLQQQVEAALAGLGASGPGSPARRLAVAVTALAAPERTLVALAVRAGAARLGEVAGGRTVELRVPPYAAVQLDDGSGGPTHTRGTPPAVVETDPETFLALAAGTLTWAEAVADRRLRRSGVHADLSARFPLA
ncbi:MAG: sterol carrier family protein [Actinomycetia bacterium]|nr:sterol carrier family protein [Actinomycetes bacterium]